ncbi:TRAP transporter large permease [Phreatobacter sp. AB_2022a]|uniref:TRAP transporter large permease n=1 Tax=Phreatobacter sp. AB_2022a TaxID=3003134 RepID=UPI002286DDC0|nr:TRAP transporter large permease [Phreatobacter sp. AB_2022a]MCZ0736131.1 TRAP transporter large permease [Phreatobacter sp. AB_2022a]
MIAIVFLLILAGTMLGLSFTGSAQASGLAGEILLLIGLFALFFGMGIYVGAALGVLGLIVGYAFSDRPFWLFLGQTIWNPSSSFVLVAVPLFLLMGEILLRAGLSDRLYRTLNIWLNRMPGGLLHTNIASSAIFSAISGSSVATAATMGSVALPFFKGRPYDPRMVLGSLAAGGALGNLIPPGITFIIYGLITETSVGALYIAAIGPSILVVLLFTAVILLRARTAAPRDPHAPVIPMTEKLKSLVDLTPTAILILIVLGTIYGGLATPTESAALGVIAALVLAAIDGKLSWKMLNDSAEATARNTAMIGLILFGAYVLNFVFTALGVPQALAKLVSEMPLPPWAIMLMIIGFYLALGTFMEGFSMIVTTIPVIFPVVIALGYDPVWFGVIVVMLVEIALISPPDGTVLYVLQGMRRDGGPISDVFTGVMPFMLVYILAIAILMVWPAIALWLPTVMR